MIFPKAPYSAGTADADALWRFSTDLWIDSGNSFGFSVRPRKNRRTKKPK